MITLTDGSQIEYHTSFNFPCHTYFKMKQEDCDTLKRERAAHNQRGGRGSRKKQELRAQIQELQQQSGSSVAVTPPTNIVSIRSQASQISTGTIIMGGRNEQANNRDARRTAAAALTKRHVKLTETLWDNPPPNTMAENECDTNANTCCLGKNFVVLTPTFRTADVYAYDTRMCRSCPVRRHTTILSQDIPTFLFSTNHCTIVINLTIRW
jgi:hypothetical protein